MFDEYQRMKDHDVVLSFKGMLSQAILVGLVEMVKEKFLLKAKNEKLVKKVYTLLIELVQNILHYSAERICSDEEGAILAMGIVLLTESDDGYTVLAGNPVENQYLPQVKRFFDSLLNMDKEEARQLYRKKLRSPRESGKSGPGASLLNIVGKSDLTIAYELNTIDDDYSFLVLSVKTFKEDQT